MARGAQVEYETLLIWNCHGDLPLADNEIPESAKHSPEGCTSLLYPAAKSSVAVIAHNEDGPPELDGHCCWLNVRQENGSKFSGLSQTVTESSSYRQQMSEKLISESTSPDPKSILFQQPSQGLPIFCRPNDDGDYYAFTLATGIFRISASGVKRKIHLNKNASPALSK